MPLTVTDFKWDQTETDVFINVPLKGVNTRNVDIFSTEDFVKINFKPFLFECLLFDKVDDITSTAKICDNVVKLNLKKLRPTIWDNLFSPDHDDKKKRGDALKRAIDRHQQRDKTVVQEQKEKKRQLGKFTVDEQIKLESEERSRIDLVKSGAKLKATEDLENLRLNKNGSNTCRLATEETPRLDKTKTCMMSKGSKEIFDTDTCDIGDSASKIRDSGKISIKFTPRVFPTAARESQADEEQEWLRKQAEARRAANIENANLSLEEKDPIWLRDKGISFYKQGNFLGAVEVFSHAIRLNQKLPSLYSNRAACHLNLGNYMKCIEDASTAIELLTPPVKQNANSRKIAHVRRGTAFCGLELYVEGLQDYEAAIAIDPNDEKLQLDANNIRTIVQGEGPPSLETNS